MDMIGGRETNGEKTNKGGGRGKRLRKIEGNEMGGACMKKERVSEKMWKGAFEKSRWKDG